MYVCFSRIVIVLIVVSRTWGDLNSHLPWLEHLKCNINELKGKSAPVFSWSSVIISSLVAPRLQEFIDQVSMSTMKLNSIKSSFLSKFNRFPELFLGDFNVIECHFFWHLMVFFESVVHISDGDWGGSLWFETPCSLSQTWPSSMKDLDKQKGPFLMNSINNFFPSLHLLLCEQVGSTWEWFSSLCPCNTLSKQETSTWSLFVILSNNISGNTILGITSLAGECGEYNSVLESELAELDFVWPVELFHLRWDKFNLYKKLWL